MPLQYVTGDATRPQGEGPQVIAHCCNDQGGWGRGFVVALSNTWPLAEKAYRQWARLKTAVEVDAAFPGQVQTSGPFALGEVQFVLVAPKLWIANIIGQHGIHTSSAGRTPIRYDAIQQGFKKLCRFALVEAASVHMPRMGAGLAGGTWTAMSQYVNAELVSHNISVTVYDLPRKD